MGRGDLLLAPINLCMYVGRREHSLILCVCVLEEDQILVLINTMCMCGGREDQVLVHIMIAHVCVGRH